ncbi:MAG: PilN domain-containing protein [Desulfobulbaceae bacterium]|jgi:type IV pilus assembly protein PilN|nr:PilN domain-containing protein [Desulfobulbaceae bacterium]
MLQINFLPVRQLKKRAKAKNQLTAFFLLLALVVALCALAWLFQSNDIDVARKENSRLTEERQRLQPTLAAIDQVNQAKEELQRKTKVIEQLKKESSLTVRVMDEVASRVDSNRLWLDSISQTGGTVDMKGIALDNESVAQFMTALKDSPFVRDVSLVESSQKLLAGRDLKSFTISCRVAPPGNAESDAQNTAPGKTAKR